MFMDSKVAPISHIRSYLALPPEYPVPLSSDCDCALLVPSPWVSSLPQQAVNILKVEALPPFALLANAPSRTRLFLNENCLTS